MPSGLIGLGSFGGMSPDSFSPGIAGESGVEPGSQSGVPQPVGQTPSALVKDPRQELVQAQEGSFGVASDATGVFTRLSSAASGTQAITGVGFRPKAVYFYMVVNNEPSASWGFDNGTNAACILTPPNGTTSTGNYDSTGTYSIVYQKSTVAGDYYQGNISTLDVDGFTVSWTKTGSPTNTMTIRYFAIR